MYTKKNVEQKKHICFVPVLGLYNNTYSTTSSSSVGVRRTVVAVRVLR